MSRILLGIALLWAVLVPAIHGHAAGAPGHRHQQPALSALADVEVEQVAHALGGHAVEAHVEVDAHEGDLPVAPAPSPIALLLPALLGLVAPVLTPELGGRRPAVDGTSARGSPVQRHEVARI